MGTFDDEIQLIGLINTRDKDGFPIVEEGKKPPILANRLSVRSNEFWSAKQEGVKLSYMFEVHSIEYQGEKSLWYEEEEHRIERTYNKGEYTELVCGRKSDNHA